MVQTRICVAIGSDRRGEEKVSFTNREQKTELSRSEAFPLAAYFIPGREGRGPGQNPEFVPPAAAASAASSPNTLKRTHTHTQKSKHKILAMGALKIDWELFSTPCCTEFRHGYFWFRSL